MACLAKIDMLMAKGAKQEEEISFLKKMNYDSLKSSQEENTNVGDYPNKADPSPRLPPSSCRQLSTIGHYLDGIYLVANPDTNKIETVYCDFGSSTLSETLFGSLDVKTKSVHFFVQRSSSFSAAGAVIPFEVERLNIGGAMNLVAGTFTAPVDGIYHFEFLGLGDTNSATNNLVYLQVNGVNIAAGWSSDLPANIFYGGLSGINASLRLKTGDQVRLYITSGALFDGIPYGYTQFSGWLVEEDVVLF